MVYPIIYKVLYIPGGAGILTSTVVAGCRGKVVPQKKDTKGVPGVSFGEGTASFLEANNMLRQEAQLQFFSPFSPAWNIVNPRKIPTKNNVLPLNLYNKSQKKTSQFRTIRYFNIFNCFSMEPKTQANKDLRTPQN